MTYGDEISEVPIVLKDPPELDIPPALWDEQQNLMKSIEEKINELHKSVLSTMDLGKRIQSINDQIDDGDENLKDLKERGIELKEKIDEWQGKVIELRQKGFQDALNWPAGMNSEFFILRNNLDTYEPSLPEGYKQRFNDVSDQWTRHSLVLEKIMEEDVANYNELFKSKNLPALTKPKEPVN